jgi:predicted cupin superfamily sugar epimerase
MEEKTKEEGSFEESIVTPRDWISRLSLRPHPEGGFFAETYRSGFSVTPPGEGETSAVTSIHYLLEGADFSAFHRIAYPELWYHHDGGGLDIHEIDSSGIYRVRRLGRGPGELLSLAVEPGTWFAAEVVDKTGYALVSCAVAPGFRFEIFEMGKRAELQRLLPRHAEIIARLTRA